MNVAEVEESFRESMFTRSKGFRKNRLVLPRFLPTACEGVGVGGCRENNVTTPTDVDEDISGSCCHDNRLKHMTGSLKVRKTKGAWSSSAAGGRSPHLDSEPPGVDRFRTGSCSGL